MSKREPKSDRQLHFEQSQPYLLGLRYRRLGDLLMNPDTALTELSDFAFELGMRVSVEITERKP